ncbi:MAG: hypothetical protein ACXQS8_08555 [Candidatus Helarchaeales archaeon]
MSKRFEQMVDRIVGKSKLNISGGTLMQCIHEEACGGPIEPFISKFNGAYLQWTKKYGNHTISPFLKWIGKALFKTFLNYVFAFDETRLDASCEVGRSNVDAVISINYVFHPEELQVIENCLKKYELTSHHPHEVAKLLLSNSTKIISRFLNKILNTPYRLYTSSVDMKPLKNRMLKVSLVYDGRIG